MTTPVTAVVAAALAVVAVGLVRHYALARAVLDHPNERSSHSVPTPRGGGLGVIVAVLLAFAGVLTVRGGWTPSLVAGVAAVVAVAVVGWLDDHRPLPVGPRLLAHVAAGAAVAWLAAGLPGPFGLAGVAASVWWVFWSVSAVNVVNFMDGIDGIIGLQVAVLGVHFALLAGDAAAGAWLGGALAGAALGFLRWNRPRALIFLGDVGSAPLGLLLVLCGALVQRATGAPHVTVFLPLFPLFLDASATLVARWRRGERLTEAHRSHLYQRLANGGWGHGPVTALYGALAAAGAGVVHASGGSPSYSAMAAYAALVTGAWVALDRTAPVVTKRNATS